MNDVYSAPPMPSETITPPSASNAASNTGTGTGAAGTGAAAAPEAVAGADTAAGSAPPPFAYPRPAGPAPQAAGTRSVRKTLADRAVPRPKAKAQVRRSTARQAHLTIARVEPWSVMKFSFAMSMIAFVVLLVAVMLLYGLLSALGVFDSLQHLVSNVTSSQNSAGVNARSWFSASRIIGYTVMLGGLNVVLITALSTIGAVVYNLTSRLIGGIEVTLKETDLLRAAPAPG